MFLEYNVIMLKTILQTAGLKKISCLMRSIHLCVMLTFLQVTRLFSPKSIKVSFFFAGLQLVQMNTFVMFCWFNRGFIICLPKKASSNVFENKGRQIVLLDLKKADRKRERYKEKKNSVCVHFIPQAFASGSFCSDL